MFFSETQCICVSRTASLERSGSSTSPIGRSKACPSQARASSTSSARCIKPRSSSDRTDPLPSTAGTCPCCDSTNATISQRPDLQNILRQSYDYLTIMPKLRSTYDERPIYKTSYEGRKAFLRYDSLVKL